MLMMESVTLVFNSNDPLVYKIPARANLLERSARQNPHDEVVPNIPSHKKRKKAKCPSNQTQTSCQCPGSAYALHYVAMVQLLQDVLEIPHNQ